VPTPQEWHADVTKALDGEDMYGPSTVILLPQFVALCLALHFHLKFNNLTAVVT